MIGPRQVADDADAVHPIEGGLLTVEQAAQFVSLSRSFLYSAMDKGELVFAKFGRARRIPRQALLDWANAHLVGGWASQALAEGDA